MRRLLFLVFLAQVCLTSQGPAAPQANIDSEILAVLESQKAAWNQRDIEGFMAYYWKSDELVFQSGNNRLKGWRALLERYKKSYAGENWGKLDFTDLEVKALAENWVYVLGRWRLTSPEASKEGLFTIILRRFPEGWRIVHDHTS
jgi:beta-aspartyl-peptidase (threonine type)